MEQLRFSSKTATVTASILTIVGIVFSILLLEQSISGGFNWYTFIPAVCYIVCLGTLTGYTLGKEAKSPTVFRTVMISYGLVLIVTGIVFPPVFPYGVKALFTAFDILVIVSLFLFDRFWNKVKMMSVILTVVLVLETVFAVIALTGNPMMKGESLTVKCSLFIRPLIIASFMTCYLARMRDKLKERK